MHAAPDTLTTTEANELDRLFALQHRLSRHEPAPTAQQRRDDLARLAAALRQHASALADAVSADFGGRSLDETYNADILPVLAAASYARSRVSRWMRPARRQVGLMFMPARARIVYQPLGVIGIVVPWNYPIQLALSPLVCALAAGNRALIKLSEFTPRTNEVLRTLISSAFPEERVAVVLGEVDVAEAFVRKPFDHLLFTGSTAVGRSVMRAAADNLTPVTLELGGKSPAIVDSDIPMDEAVAPLAWGKTLNAGQTCIAPDYVLCPEQRVDEFVAAFGKQLSRLYPRLLNNPDYTSIVNERQYQRLRELLVDAQAKGADVIALNPGNESFEGTRKLPPHLVRNVDDGMRLMREEIFGPILPIVPYRDLDAAIAYVNARPRPLALYYFGHDKHAQDAVLERTCSGGVCINDTLLHIAQDSLPFGGVGPSGMGHYHGYEGFLTFSKAKPVFVRGKLNPAKLAYPPYGRWIHKLIRKLIS